MKTKCLLLLLLLFISLFSIQLQAQTFSKSINNKIVTDSKVTLTDNNTHSLNQNYIIEASKSDSNYFDVILKSDNNQEETFRIHPLSIDLFSAKFKNSFLKLAAKAEGKSIKNTSTFNELQISYLFAQLVTFERTEDERPVVANITLKQDIPVKIMITDSTFEVKTIDEAKLELTFFNGYIEKVELETELYGTKVRFTNTYSIGISSSNGIKNFTKNNILSFYKYKFDKSKLTRDYYGYYLTINFADIIDYDREIDINANDISPEPTKLVLDETQKTTKLYKEQSTKLFEAIVYSDFLGVFDEENPNGIIQTEIAKKFYINTHRYEITPKGRFLGLLFPPIAFSEGYGWFEYVNLSAMLSKIEENNKFLQPSTISTVDYFSPINIMQHQSFSIGLDINLLYLENQNKKINTNFDFGVRFGRSGLQIDESTQEFFNSITTTIELGFQFIPEKRYGLLISEKLMHFQVYNDDNFNVMSLKNGELVSPENLFNKTQFEFFVNTSTTGKLFIRYNLITELADWDNNYSQFQFGYSFYLLKQNGKSK
ncbi:hypothetical protein [Confluentibacter flavum]|uniref:Uncharacterized protein n=1 Tax=Confluentibacter flavum TaxID=1909700 RepID=A0A2N3HMC3_9FLAO|nr:hypothetical protein [Confluentibacter flavum]PKQ46085.1 hypothetical protein CSW08_04910 [Confluentibacter flavum]